MMFNLGDLQLGARGAAVSDLQRKLNAAGYDVGPSGVDGIFGDDTRLALEAFQSDRGLSVTGVADAATLAALSGGGSAPAPGPAPEELTPPTDAPSSLVSRIPTWAWIGSGVAAVWFLYFRRAGASARKKTPGA